MAKLNATSLLRLLPILALLALWQSIAMSGTLSEFLLPSATTVFQRVWEDATSGALFVNIGATLYRSLIAFAIAATLGILVGLSMSVSGGIRWFFDPVISVGFPMPKVALLPIFVLWLGLDDASKIALTGFSCFFVIAANAYAGAEGVERQLLWSAQMLGASRREMLTDIVLPAAAPQILTGLQIALPIALISMLVAEMIMGGTGLGAQLLQAQRFADSPGVFATIVEIAIAGALVVNSMIFMRQRLLRWHQEADPASM